MGIFDTFTSKPKIKGLIAYHGLIDWWLIEFNENERNHIEETYSPMGSGNYILTKANIESSSASVIHFLTYLADWFDNKRDRHLALKIINKAEELVNDKIPIMDIHFLYLIISGVHYGNRKNDPNSLDKVNSIMEKQVEIASQVAKAFKKGDKDAYLPTHLGYLHVIGIKEKEKKYQEAIDICLKALKEGWHNGDWENTILRCQKQLNG